MLYDSYISRVYNLTVLARRPCSMRVYTQSIYSPPVLPPQPKIEYRSPVLILGAMACRAYVVVGIGRRRTREELAWTVTLMGHESYDYESHSESE
jgi:hypothetical protein